MKDGLYRHLNFSDLIVSIKSRCIIELVEEPFYHDKMTLWSLVRPWWVQMIEDGRPLSKDEEIYFIDVKEN